MDVERNLRAPLAGIAHIAERLGETFWTPRIAIRTGDTPQADRARFQREPADILITTPESLYLLLTSNARESLRSIDTVIIDEIHALVPTKRGAHLALSLERLEAICKQSPQRIGLSATQRPLDEVARFLGGTQRVRRQSSVISRRSVRVTVTRVRIVPEQAARRRGRCGDSANRRGVRCSSQRRALSAGHDRRRRREKGPQADHRRAGRGHGASWTRPTAFPAARRGRARARPSIWSAIHPRLLELIRAHRSTLIFVNSRRLAERLAGALNELAGETLVRSHHGSIARPQRARGRGPAQGRRVARAGRHLVARARHRHGRDRPGRADRSAADGRQRPAANRPRRPPGERGQRGRHLSRSSAAIWSPAPRSPRRCTTATVEATRYPRNPLDIVAQQIVAMAAMDEWDVDELFATIRRAAPFAELSRDRVRRRARHALGPLPLRRIRGAAAARHVGPRRAAPSSRARARSGSPIANGGTIPDRGLYGVFLRRRRARRGARRRARRRDGVRKPRRARRSCSAPRRWRIEEITHDRVLVSPAPGEPGKMPFWKGDRAGRPLELGLAIGTADARPAAAAAGGGDRAADARARSRRARRREPARSTCAIRWPRRAPCPTPRPSSSSGCATSSATGASACCRRAAAAFTRRGRWPSPRRSARRPASTSKRCGATMGSWCGFRMSTSRRIRGCCCPIRTKCRRSWSGSWARRRCSPRSSARTPRGRCCCRSAGPACARRSGSSASAPPICWRSPRATDRFRCCSRPIANACATSSTCRRSSRRSRDVRSRTIRVATVDSRDAVAVRRVAALQLRRELPLRRRRAARRASRPGAGRRSGAAARAARRRRAARAARRRVDGRASSGSCSGSIRSTTRKSADARPRHAARARRPHAEELACASASSARRRREPSARSSRARRVARRCASPASARYIAVEDAARYRDALGVPLPPGIPESLLEPVRDPLGDLALRYARTHAPFPAADFAARYGLGVPAAEAVLMRLAGEGRLVEGEFRPGGTRREWTDAGVLRMLRRRSLAKLRHEVEPVEQAVLGRFATTWQGVVKRRHGADALLDAIEQLQGAPLPASILETEILPARIEGYDPARSRRRDRGRRSGLGRRRAARRARRPRRVVSRRPPAAAAAACRRRRDRRRSLPDARPRSSTTFARSAARRSSAPLHEAVGGGYPAETVDALVEPGLAGTGHQRHVPRAARVHARARAAPQGAARPRSHVTRVSLAPRSRRRQPKDAGSLVARDAPRSKPRATTQVGRRDRRSSCSRATASSRARRSPPKRIAGGFGLGLSGAEGDGRSGRIRRGYFVAGLGATQFALPGALDLLRSLRDAPERDRGRGARRDRSGEPVRRHVEVAGLDRRHAVGAGGSRREPDDSRGLSRGTRTDANGRRDGDSRQRRARGLSGARRSAADDVSSGRRAGTIESRHAPSRAC